MPQIPNRDNRLPLIKAENVSKFVQEANKKVMTKEQKEFCAEVGKLFKYGKRKS